jgi:HD-like signal output (HDOD) protein
VSGIILRNSFPTVTNLERFWDASGRIALLSGWLSQELTISGLLAEDAYTFGLFRDCGIPVVLRWFPKYREILEEANQDSVHSFIEVEQSKLPTNHAKVGSVLAHSWWLPEEICFAIRNHHDLAILESDNSELTLSGRRLIAIAQVAEYILQQQLKLSLTQEWPKLGKACMKLLNLNDESLEKLLADAKGRQPN